MPRDRESPLARLAHAIAEGHVFSFGMPHLSDDGSTVTLPILRRDAPPRRYVLATESSETISAVDIGRIDRVRIQNDSPTRVFLPQGTVLEGPGTTSRGTTAGVVLDPGATSDLAVKCVQPAQPIRPGAILGPSAQFAPGPVAHALMTRDQGWVWETVGWASALPSASDHPIAAGNQCGALLLDAEGVAAVEFYDHPDSWQAGSRALVVERAQRHGSRRLSLNVEGALPIAREFLLGLSDKRFHRAGPGAWVADDASAAYAVLDDEVIHLLAFGRPLAVPDSAPPAVDEGAVAVSEDLPLSSVEPGTDGFHGTEDVAVGAIALQDVQLEEAADFAHPADRPRRRKVLTSGWDAATFGTLERYAAKEFQGDRSAAIRFLVRHELRARGYMGPGPLPGVSFAGAPAEVAESSPPAEMGRATAEARILDLERIVQTGSYADWLRGRARSELERIAATAADGLLQSAARSALDRLPAEVPAEEEIPEPVETEAPSAPAPPPLSPVDVRPLLRRAFADSAGGRYPEALILFDEILLAEPDNRTALLGRAVALRRSGKTQDALDALGVVLEKEPTNAAALLNRGRILQERGDLEGALDAVERLASVAPNDWDVWMVRGDILARMGRDRDAREAYSEALRRNPEDGELLAKIHALEKVQPAPPPSPLQRLPLPRDVQDGQSYLVKERRPDLSVRVLRALMLRTVPALLITPRSAEVVRRESGLAGIRTLELSHTPGEGRHDPTALAALTHVVERFLRENHLRGVIALEGLPSLVLENGFRETALFIERVHETILQSHALFLVSVAPGDLEDRERALLERSLKVLT